MIEALHKFKRIVISTLILMLALVNLLSVVKLGWVLMAAIILALFGGYWVIKNSNRRASCKTSQTNQTSE